MSMDNLMAAPPGMMADAGNDDKTEATVQASVDAANARNAELHSDTLTTTIGDVMAMPDVPSDEGKMTGGEMAHGGDYGFDEEE